MALFTVLLMHFLQKVCGSGHYLESDIVQACRNVSSLLPNHEIPLYLIVSNHKLKALFIFIVQLLDERQGENIWRFLHSINEYALPPLILFPSQWEYFISWSSYKLHSIRRHDLTDALRKLQCRTLIFVGENSQFHEDAIHMTTKLDKRYCALVEVTYGSNLCR